MIRQGKLRADKTKFKDGVGCCVWYPLPSLEEDTEDSTELSNLSEEDEDDYGGGLCFDFGEDDIDDLIQLLQKLKLEEATEYKEPIETIEEQEAREKECKTREEKINNDIYRMLNEGIIVEHDNILDRMESQSHMVDLIRKLVIHMRDAIPVAWLQFNLVNDARSWEEKKENLLHRMNAHDWSE